MPLPIIRNKWLIKLFFLFLLSSCSATVKELRQFPSEQRSLYMENFTNTTFEPYIHNEFYEVLRQEFHRRNSLPVKKNANDATYSMTGNIFLFRREVLMYQNEVSPAAYRVDMGVSVQLRKKNRVIFSQEFYEMTNYTLLQSLAEDDIMARHRIYRKIGQSIAREIELAILKDIKDNETENTLEIPETR